MRTRLKKYLRQAEIGLVLFCMFSILLCPAIVQATGSSPVRVLGCSISNGSVVEGDVTITFTFSNNVVNETVRDNNKNLFAILDSSGNKVAIKVIMADDMINPDLRRNISIKALNRLSGGSYKAIAYAGITAKNGFSTDADYVVSFTVKEVEPEPTEPEPTEPEPTEPEPTEPESTAAPETEHPAEKPEDSGGSGNGSGSGGASEEGEHGGGTGTEGGESSESGNSGGNYGEGSGNPAEQTTAAQRESKPAETAKAPERDKPEETGRTPETTKAEETVETTAFEGVHLMEEESEDTASGSIHLLKIFLSEKSGKLLYWKEKGNKSEENGMAQTQGSGDDLLCFVLLGAVILLVSGAGLRYLQFRRGITGTEDKNNISGSDQEKGDKGE